MGGVCEDAGEACFGDPCVGRGFRSEVWSEDFPADDVNSEAKTDQGPLRSPSSKGTQEGRTPPWAFYKMYCN